MKPHPFTRLARRRIAEAVQVPHAYRQFLPGVQALTRSPLLTNRSKTLDGFDGLAGIGKELKKVKKKAQKTVRSIAAPVKKAINKTPVVNVVVNKVASVVKQLGDNIKDGTAPNIALRDLNRKLAPWKQGHGGGGGGGGQVSVPGVVDDAEPGQVASLFQNAGPIKQPMPSFQSSGSAGGGGDFYQDPSLLAPAEPEAVAPETSSPLKPMAWISAGLTALSFLR